MGLEGTLVVSKKMVEEIARNFLAQNHSVLDVRDPILEDHTWMVDADVMLFSTYHRKTVKINAETGRILACESRPYPKIASL